MPDRDLRLNSVSRYAKESSRLILEEHSHCEIPAGCGGVVLRWFNPVRAMPLEFWAFVDGDFEFALDGETTKSARPLVDYGEHVVSFVVRDFPIKTGILMFAATLEIKKMSATVETKFSKREFLSDADGSWKYTLKAPHGDSWMRPGFNDTGWETLVSKPVARPDEMGSRSYNYGKLRELGANGLGIDAGGNWLSKLIAPTPPPDCIWIRRVFRLTPPANE